MFDEIKPALIILFLATFLIACNGGKMAEEKVHFTSIKDIPNSAWEKLSQKKIFFGHQSVGFNIIDGLKDIMKEYPQIKLNIVETSNPADFDAPLFAHARVGKNKDPKSKIDAFAHIMEKGIGNKADIAFLKFCYVDVMAGTDVHKVFTEYMNTMSRLKKTYPETNFIHVTVPLTTRQTGIKARIKKLIGKPVGGYDNNIKRNEFNELLKKEYNGKEPVFDLAKVESTHPDGRTETFTKDGDIFYSLVPDYTYDGGHLNETGRKKAVEQLLLLLADPVRSKQFLGMQSLRE